MRETLGVLLGFFLAAVLGYLISEIAQKEQEKEVLESYMDSLQEIYEVIRQRMDVTRKFRHDLLSHVQTLEYLIEKQKNPDGELRKYADQLTETYRKIQRGTFCRDEITDAFLMMEKQVCIEKEIPFQIQVSKTCMEWMMPVERIGFLHNLLDNAIEANGRIPEKERKRAFFLDRRRFRFLYGEIEKCACKQRGFQLINLENRWSRTRRGNQNHSCHC